jgi:hypothetical protein
MRRLTVAILALGSVVGSQKLRAKGTDTETAQNVSSRSSTLRAAITRRHSSEHPVPTSK